MSQKYFQQTSGEDLSKPAVDAASVTPNDSTDLSRFARALWVGVAGDVAIDTPFGNTVTLKNAQGLVPVAAARVRSTNTTATDIVALF